MQTFLPFAHDFDRSLRQLDRRRLGKQRVETLQLLNALTGVSSGWRQHPAAVMWIGYEPALIQYGVRCCDIWREHGYRDTCRDKILDHLPVVLACRGNTGMPYWSGGAIADRLSATHRYQLFRKDPQFYAKWEDEPEAEYYWPPRAGVDPPIWELVEVGADHKTEDDES